MKKLLLMASALVLCTTLSACGSSNANDEEGKTILRIAGLEGGYGVDHWKALEEAFEAKHGDVDVVLEFASNIEEILRPQMQAGDYPDLMYLGLGREAALTETLIKENALEDLSGFLQMNVPSESVTVKDKIIPGFTDTLATNPYNDGKTYLAPIFYSPTGLFYNKALFVEKGWELPTTWDEFFALGDQARTEGIYLMSYPTSGYFDGFFFALLAEAGGVELFNDAMLYKEGVWTSPEATQAFEIMGKLKDYMEPTTVANANGQGFKKNQQLLLDNKVLFLPNGTWLPGEMEDAPKAAGFEYGFMGLPKIDTDSYSYTFFEQMYIPKKAENKELAKEFMAYMYSDEAVERIAKTSGAVMPVLGADAFLSGLDQEFYSIYDQGTKAVMGNFAATESVEGVTFYDTLFSAIDSVMAGEKTVEQWQAAVEADSGKLRKALK